MSTPSVEAIVEGLKEHVWTLVRAEQIDAALVLIGAVAEDYLIALKATKGSEEDADAVDVDTSVIPLRPPLVAVG